MKNKNNVPGLKLELKVLSILEEAIRSYDLLPSDNHHLNRYLKTRDFFRQYLLIRNMRDDLSTDVYIKKMKEFKESIDSHIMDNYFQDSVVKWANDIINN